MTGAITDPPADLATPSYFMGICDICRSVKTFTTARERDLWEKHHPHDEGLS